MPAYQLVKDNSLLNQLCQKWHSVSRLAIDTEFDRGRHYFATLSLVQVNDGENTYLIDALAISDFSPFIELLTAAQPIKILHAAREDMEIFYHLAGKQAAAGVRDTQLGAALAGMGAQLGYARLCELLFNARVSKAQSRSDWLRRPLSEAQLDYAAEDVAYLFEIDDYLNARLGCLNRLSWWQQDCEAAYAADALDVMANGGYQRFAQQHRMNAVQLSMIRALYNWREHEARDRDRPRTHVLANADLMRLAQKQPEDADDIRRLFNNPSVRKKADRLAEVIEAAREEPESERPQPDPDVAIDALRECHKRIKRQIRNEAKVLGLAPNLIANRAQIDTWARAHLGDREPEFSTDWRAAFQKKALENALR